VSGRNRENFRERMRMMMSADSRDHAEERKSRRARESKMGRSGMHKRTEEMGGKESK